MSYLSHGTRRRRPHLSSWLLLIAFALFVACCVVAVWEIAS